FQFFDTLRNFFINSFSLFLLTTYVVKSPFEFPNPQKTNFIFSYHTSNEKKSPKISNPFWHEKQCIFTNQPSYFCLFLPICESVANFHESTLLFASNIHAYFCLFFII